MKLDSWNLHVKRSLKAEMVKRGISNEELANRLSAIGVAETKSSVSNKISRGTFSAAFLNQCLYVLGCANLEIEAPITIAAEKPGTYKKKNKTKK